MRARLRLVLLAVGLLVAPGCHWFGDDWDDPYETECWRPIEPVQTKVSSPAIPGIRQVPAP